MDPPTPVALGVLELRLPPAALAGGAVGECGTPVPLPPLVNDAEAENSPTGAKGLLPTPPTGCPDPELSEDNVCVIDGVKDPVRPRFTR